MSVELVGIVYDRAQGTPETGALHIRYDGATPAGADVAAYALRPTKGRRLTIEAELRFPQVDGAGPTSGETIKVRAQAPGTGPRVLGQVRAREVTVPSPGQTQRFTFTLSAPKLHAVGIGKYEVVWNWQFQLAPGTPWVTFHASRATVYVTLDVPVLPWTQKVDAASQRLWPWIRMLDLACQWASGVTLAGGKAAAAKKVAKRVEDAVYELGTTGKFVYQGTEARYAHGTGASVFELTRFLTDVEGPDTGLSIYCTECAMAVATGVNCLGGDLALLRLMRPVASIELNSYVLIGRKSANEGGFRYHDIVVRPTATNWQVFDATLRPDWDVDVTDNVHVYRLTQGRRLGIRRLDPTGTAYLQRLLEARVAAQFGDLDLHDKVMLCLDQCDAPFQDPSTMRLFASYLEQIEAVSPAAPVIFPEPKMIRVVPLEGFRPVRRDDGPRRAKSMSDLVTSSVEFGYVGTDVGPPRVRSAQFRLLVAWAATPRRAHEALAWLLVSTDAALSSFRPRDREPIGDACLVSRQKAVLYAVRGNVVFQVSSVGDRLAPAEVISRQVDRAIVSDWSRTPPPRGRAPKKGD